MESRLDESLDLEAFAHIVAHDLGAPLRGISIHLRLLQRDLDEGKHDTGRERIAMLQERLRQMDGMLRRIRGFSRIQAGLEQSGPTELATAVHECWGRLAAPGHHLTVTGSGETACPPLLVHMVLAEILRNAVEHDDRDGGEVRVTIDGSTVTFEDDGPGLPAAPSELLQPFAKAGAHVDDGRGTGLALANYATQHMGGRLALESSERGTTVRIVLP